MPYSDPIADGPVIAESYTRALHKGIKVESILDMIRRLREGPASSTGPIVTMVSYAIVHGRGVERYLDQAKTAGVRRLDRPRLAGRGSRFARGGGEIARPAAHPARHADHSERTRLEDRRDDVGVPLLRLGRGDHRRTQGLADRPGLERRLAARANPFADLRRLRHRRCRTSPRLAPVADGLIVGSALVRRIGAASARGLSKDALVAEIGGFIAELEDALRI